MQANYLFEAELYEKCLTLMDSCFPGIKLLADSGREHNAYWDKSSTPFIIKYKNEIIAHLGLLPFQFLIQERHYKGAAIHGVCTKTEFRRKGYFKHLMLEALEHVRQHFDFAFMFTDKPYLYEQFGFKVIKEYDFLHDYTPKNRHENKIRMLDLDKSQDLALLQSHYQNRFPLSQAFSIVKETTVSTLNSLHQPVYYIKDFDALIVYQIKNDVIYLKDLITTNPCEIDQILGYIEDHFSKVVLQFIPDRFLKLPFHPIEALTDGYIMMSEDFDLNCHYFRYPELQRC